MLFCLLRECQKSKISHTRAASLGSLERGQRPISVHHHPSAKGVIYFSAKKVRDTKLRAKVLGCNLTEGSGGIRLFAAFLCRDYCEDIT